MGVDAYPEYTRVINISTWSGLVIESGLITILYRKLEDKAFAPPLDADQRNIGERWEAEFEPYFIGD